MTATSTIRINPPLAAPFGGVMNEARSWQPLAERMIGEGTLFAVIIFLVAIIYGAFA